jgi:hypothetical protein
MGMPYMQSKQSPRMQIQPIKQKTRQNTQMQILQNNSRNNKMTKILHLTLKKEWFDQIAAGEKVEEYRENKPYWTKRLVDSANRYKQFNEIHFRNGYSKNAPFMKVKAGCIFKAYRKLEGQEQLVYIIELKEIIEVSR